MMFFVWQLKNSIPLSDEDRKELCSLLDAYEKTPEGDWMKGLPWRAFHYRWCNSFGDDILGAFNPLFRKTVFLRPPAEYNNHSFWLLTIADVIVHELTHAFQWQNSPVAYCFLSIFSILFAQTKYAPLEKPALKNQEASRPFWRNIDKKSSAAWFSQFMKRNEKNEN